MEPRDGLYDDIIARIRKEKNLYAVRRRLLIFITGLFGSVAAFWPALRMLETDLASSGFMQFLSLVFSDFGTIAVYSQNFAFALLESLPAFSIALCLALIAVFLKSLQALSRDLKLMLTS